MFDILDRIMNLDIGKRGVDRLYEPARARCEEALCAAAARSLTKLAPATAWSDHRLADPILGLGQDRRDRWPRSAPPHWRGR